MPARGAVRPYRALEACVSPALRTRSITGIDE